MKEMKTKRWLCALLCVLLCIGLLPTTALAAALGKSAYVRRAFPGL